jgi:nucleotide-binding universal stress UspA family protein
MLRTILLGLDGDPRLSAGVQVGLDWARRFDAMLVGIGVVDAQALRGVSVGRRGGYLEKLQQHWVKEAEGEMDRLLHAFSLCCCEKGVACKLLEDTGVPWEKILEEAQRFDLIMLGQGTYFESQSDSYKTLSHVLQHACRPVVVVPDATELGNDAVLVAYDGSMQAARALQVFAMSGLHSLGQVYVLCLEPLDAAVAARTADRAVQFLSSHGITAVPVPVAQSQPASKVILNKAAELNAGLIVMGAYGRTRFEEFFLGSVTKRLLKESPLPLFLYH